MTDKLVSRELMRTLRDQFRLDWNGIHGGPHWARVRYHGVVLAKAMKLQPNVPALFAVIHDSQRLCDDCDPDHGLRAADYADRLRFSGLIDLDAISMRLLKHALELHSDGHREAPELVQICWDADRLDLGRVGIRPDPDLLCTDHARSPAVIERAWRWSRVHVSLKRIGPRPSPLFEQRDRHGV